MAKTSHHGFIAGFTQYAEWRLNNRFFFTAIRPASCKRKVFEGIKAEMRLYFFFMDYIFFFRCQKFTLKIRFKVRSLGLPLKHKYENMGWHNTNHSLFRHLDIVKTVQTSQDSFGLYRPFQNFQTQFKTWNMSHGARKVSHSARKVLRGARMGLHGARKVSCDGRKVSDGSRKVSNGARKVSHGARKVPHVARKLTHGAWKVSHSVRKV